MAKKRAIKEVEVLELPGLLASDAEEFFYWIAWKIATGQFVPATVAELAEWIGAELELNPEPEKE